MITDCWQHYLIYNRSSSVRSRDRVISPTYSQVEMATFVTNANETPRSANLGPWGLPTSDPGIFVGPLWYIHHDRTHLQLCVSWDFKEINPQYNVCRNVKVSSKTVSWSFQWYFPKNSSFHNYPSCFHFLTSTAQEIVVYLRISIEKCYIRFACSTAMWIKLNIKKALSIEKIADFSRRIILPQYSLYVEICYSSSCFSLHHISWSPYRVRTQPLTANQYCQNS